MNPSNTLPIAWTIAGSDASAGAGIQADLKTMQAFGVYACTVPTALTAQNHTGVHHTLPVPPDFLRKQLDTLRSDFPPAALKTGMLGTTENAEILADFLEETQIPCICDPVLRSTSGATLLPLDALKILRERILPQTLLLTPNLQEAEILLECQNESPESMAAELLKRGVASVLIKGGHAGGDTSRDYWTDGEEAFWLSSPRIHTTATHGTGCILSAAITAGIARGDPLPTALIHAKTFLNQSLKKPLSTAPGHPPMQLTPFRDHPDDRPEILPA